MAKNRVQYGLTNVHYALIEREADGSYKYGEPVRLAGAVTLEANPTGDSNNFYADNGVYFSRTANTGYEGTLSIAMITEKFRTDVLGEKIVKGGLLESSDARPNDVALLFEIDGDEEATRFVFFDVSIARPSQTANTVAESIEIEGQELTFTAKPRLTDKAIRWNTGEATTKEEYDNFFKQVISLDEVTPPTGD